ncbi:MAG: adenylosuccinate synthase [Candidatus Cloacimonetes bacterium HGW-Cloacimonetes-2]|nr:MAG: adenylosuccinate synthase [Candidatus Cloacimonetes bacterium HGW-Cloacimonetes-2]
MSSLAVLGCMWGDEAKAKIVDYLGDRADYVVRFQGGSNAGHTIHHAGQKYVFHSVPSGILYPASKCVIASGVVIDPFALVDEIEALAGLGIDFTDRFYIDSRAGLVLPLHQELDNRSEKLLGDSKIGTTKRGIGPAYADIASRVAIRFGDLAYPDWLKERVVALYLHHHQNVVKSELEELLDRLSKAYDKLKSFVCATDELLRAAYMEDQYILFEGAQGTLLDLSYGTYPYVTSSNTISGGICTGAGIPPRMIDKCLGVYKAYSTRVGEGPFPTELLNEIGDKIRIRGNEFGSTTGRPRRVGYFDAVAAAYTANLNGLDAIAVTLLDVLSGVEDLKICTGYWIGDRRLESFPAHPLDLAQVKPEYLDMPGWEAEISDCRSLGKLPKAAREYLEVIQDLVQRPIELVSVGKDRNQTINLLAKK